MNGSDVIIIGLLILFLTLLTLKFIAPPCIARVEKFQDISPNTMNCPRGTKSFTNSDGNIQCCRGEVTGNRCEGKVACKISASADNIPFCKAGFQKKWDGEVPEFIKNVVKNMSLIENFSYDKLRDNIFAGYIYAISAGNKYNFNTKNKIIDDCSVRIETDKLENYAKKEYDWFNQLIKDIQNNKYSKSEIDEILEDELSYLYFTFPPLYMPYITKLETCIQLKTIQQK